MFDPHARDLDPLIWWAHLSCRAGPHSTETLPIQQHGDPRDHCMTDIHWINTVTAGTQGLTQIWETTGHCMLAYNTAGTPPLSHTKHQINRPRPRLAYVNRLCTCVPLYMCVCSTGEGSVCLVFHIKAPQMGLRYSLPDF